MRIGSLFLGLLEATRHIKNMNTLRPQCWEKSKPYEEARWRRSHVWRVSRRVGEEAILEGYPPAPATVADVRG